MWLISLDQVTFILLYIFVCFLPSSAHGLFNILSAGWELGVFFGFCLCLVGMVCACGVSLGLLALQHVENDILGIQGGQNFYNAYS